MTLKRTFLATLAVAAAALGSAVVHAQQPVLNLYSSRHYQTDEALYADFTRATGIRINRIEAGEAELLERIRNEGANSPADVLLTVDASRLEKAEKDGFFQPLGSTALEQRVPAYLRTPTWVAFSTRARVLVLAKGKVEPSTVQTYEDLAQPRLKGQLCVRSGAHPYNLSLGGAMIAASGEAATEAWARGVVANLARAPKGGDTDQIKAVAAGECNVALVNSYYVARLMRSTKPEDVAVVEKIAVVWPNQANRGTHVNVSGGGILKNAPNRANAVKFLEYLASDQAQVYFADGNNEWPVVPGVKVKNPALDRLGDFKVDQTPLTTWAPLTAQAQRVYDRAGWR